MKHKLLVALGISLTSCGTEISTHYYPLRAEVRPPTTHALPLYTRGSPLPSEPYAELAIVQARGDGSPADLFRLLAIQATALGADAIIDVRIDRGQMESSAIGTAITWER